MVDRGNKTITHTYYTKLDVTMSHSQFRVTVDWLEASVSIAIFVGKCKYLVTVAVCRNTKGNIHNASCFGTNIIN